MSSFRDVARALLGTWPNQVAAWGDDGVSAYCAELAARGVTPDTALLAIRAYNPDADFPPSAAKLAQVARRDPAAPAALEIEQILWGPGGVMHARAAYPKGHFNENDEWVPGGFRGPFGRQEADERARVDAAVKHGPLITAFVEFAGVRALIDKDPTDEAWGGANSHWLAQKWDEFQAKAEERGIAALIAGRHLDPLAELRRRAGQAQASDRIALEESHG